MMSDSKCDTLTSQHHTQQPPHSDLSTHGPLDNSHTHHLLLMESCPAYKLYKQHDHRATQILHRTTQATQLHCHNCDRPDTMCMPSPSPCCSILFHTPPELHSCCYMPILPDMHYSLSIPTVQTYLLNTQQEPTLA